MTDFDRWNKSHILDSEQFSCLGKVAVAKDTNGIIICHWGIDAITNTVITNRTRIRTNKMMDIFTRLPANLTCLCFREQKLCLTPLRLGLKYSSSNILSNRLRLVVCGTAEFIKSTHLTIQCQSNLRCNRHINVHACCPLS